MKKMPRGQSTAEYVAGLVMLILVLFMPIPPLDDRSVAEFLADAFQTNYRAYEYMMSQPASE